MNPMWWLIPALAAAVAVSAQPEPATPPGDAYVYKTLGERQLKLYVVKPPDWKATDRRPAIVFFHGGGWVGGRPTQFSPHCEYLASRGMVAIQVEYRLLQGKTESPLVCVYDARSAMRWVRSHAAELGIDPNRIASGGGSAGGHLAAHVGMVDALDDPADDLKVSPKSNAMVLFNPVFDNGPTGWGTARVGERWQEFSPFHNVSADDPPAIVFVGSEDKLLPVKTVLAFQEAMQKVGVRCDVKVFEGRGHGFFNVGRTGSDDYYATLLATDEFLTSLGWLTGPPTLQKPQKTQTTGTPQNP
jgi:acetyl esterase/lipase